MDGRLRMADCRLKTEDAGLIRSGDRAAQMARKRKGKDKVHHGDTERHGEDKGRKRIGKAVQSSCFVRLQGASPVLISSLFFFHSVSLRVSVVNFAPLSSICNLKSPIRNSFPGGLWHS